jgi:hypothetical protein
MAEAAENEAKSYGLAFEEAGRALDAQERAVNELRSRAGVLIAAAAITTSFFGSRAITGDGLSALPLHSRLLRSRSSQARCRVRRAVEATATRSN